LISPDAAFGDQRFGEGKALYLLAKPLPIILAIAFDQYA
jgi:hypothetical protein